MPADQLDGDRCVGNTLRRQWGRPTIHRFFATRECFAEETLLDGRPVSWS